MKIEINAALEAEWQQDPTFAHIRTLALGPYRATVARKAHSDGREYWLYSVNGYVKHGSARLSSSASTEADAREECETAIAEWVRFLGETSAAETHRADVAVDDSVTPEAWLDLLEGLAIIARHPGNAVSPLSCSHDRLDVMADPSEFTEEERDLLAAWGFEPDDENGTFYSFRFGSA